MQSLWNDNEAAKCKGDLLKLRVYTSKLLGQEPDLVLHGGGNTSVKAQATNLFGETEDILYVKGSGWDLATIEEEGFAPVKMDILLKMADLESLNDLDMVKGQRTAMTNPSAPNPSVEAILHAIIPFKFVDHTHADSVVAVTNTDNGEKKIRDIYGDRVLVVPYIMPGFILARKVYEMAKGADWSKYEAVILLNHGVFTFDDDARKSYERMISIVTEAEDYLRKKGAVRVPAHSEAQENLLFLSKIRKAVSKVKGSPVLAKLDADTEHVSFSDLKNVSSIASRGPLTPDHVIRTKRVPLIIGDKFEIDIKNFVKDYEKYFEKNKNGKLKQLDPAPRWAVWPGHGIISFGQTAREAGVISDITTHTIRAIEKAEALGGWKALPEKDIFDVEYWVLEQAKIKKDSTPSLKGKVALVSGGASGIGKSCVEALYAQGAVVVALDINPDITVGLFKHPGVLGLVCDVTNADSIKSAVKTAVRQFGGLDILISNAGTFPASERIEEMKPETWDKSMDINLSSHKNLLQACVPYLSNGIDPAVVFIASKNVPAPGPGASAYSVAKAGLTQLARVAALELGPAGIRVNVVHPNAVFDTGIWTEDVLSKRAKSYDLSIDEYKRNNIMKVEITSRDVADLAAVMVGSVFSKTTGTQVTIDGGNDRVI